MGPVTTQQTFFPRPPTAHDVGVRNPVTWLSTTLGAKDAGPPQWCAQAPPWPHCGPAPAALVAPAQVKAGGKGSLLVSEALWASVGALGLWCPPPAIQGSEAAGGPGLGGVRQGLAAPLTTHPLPGPLGSCAPSCRRRRSSSSRRCCTSTATGPRCTSSASTCGSSTGTAASSCCSVSPGPTGAPLGVGPSQRARGVLPPGRQQRAPGEPDGGRGRSRAACRGPGEAPQRSGVGLLRGLEGAAWARGCAPGLHRPRFRPGPVGPRPLPGWGQTGRRAGWGPPGRGAPVAGRRVLSAGGAGAGVLHACRSAALHP